MKKYFLIFICSFFYKANAQNYSVTLINDSLLKGANAVIRSDELIVNIKASNKAIVKHKYAITILNEEGAKFAQYYNNYGKFCSLEKIDGRLFDATGKEIKSVKKKDITDFSANGDMNLMTDTRYKSHHFYWAQYPYTIEYEDEQTYNGIFFLPSWQPLNENCSVVQSNFMVEVDSAYMLRYKQIAYDAIVVKNTVKNKNIYSWQLKNIPATAYEPYQPNWNELNTAVYIAPSTFEIDNYKGEMNSWLSLGKFINTLNANKQELPDNVKQDIHTLTDNIKNTKEKINIVYQYLQKNTRYISVQIGIGGWQPYDAKYVASKKYGDCKALSNYMVSLLKEVNIPAKYVLVNSGENKNGLWEDFSANFFNHAIVCVPLQKDSVWLECTSQTDSPKYMGSYTGNRKVLLIDEDGGHVISTPSYKSIDNLQIRKVEAEISAEGTLLAKVFTHFTGIQQEDVNSLMHSASPDQQKRYLNQTISLPTYTIEKYGYKETKGMIPAIDEYLEIKSPFYASITGKRLFLTPNFFNRSNNKLEENKNRKYDIKFSTSYIDIDTLLIKIPSNYTAESIAKPIALKTAYGNYTISFSIIGNMINVIRKNERNQGRFPKEKYEDVRNFFNEIYKADRTKIVLIKKD